LKELIDSAWDSAVDQAAIEAAEGIYNFRPIQQMVSRDELVQQAFLLIVQD
jgi:hypothetical protein